MLLLLLLLIPWVTTQVAQCASYGSPQLRFVAQLSVSGCALFVHDTGASDGPHLEVEPIMCVTEGLQKLRYDFFTQQTYMSVPVTLRDDAMLAEAQRQLRHLLPKSMKFATVSDISVYTDNSSRFQVLGFIWSPEETAGFLRQGCSSSSENCKIGKLGFGYTYRKTEFEALDQVMLSAAVISNDTTLQLKYRLQVQNRSFINPDFYIDRFASFQKCEQLRFVRSIHLSNCTARVHQRLDMKGHFLIEPLLCHNITSMSNESVRYDYSRDMPYLKLDVVLQDDMTLDAVRTQLADLSPRNVTFMRLWRAQSHVASALSRRFEIGPLMVSGDGRSAQLRVYCGTQDECISLRWTVSAEPFGLWRHAKWTVTSLADVQPCALVSPVPRSAFQVRAFDSLGYDVSRRWSVSCRVIPLTLPSLNQCHFASQPDGRMFLIIQQRLTGSVSFQQGWTEYEKGFGDDSDFWIGLSAIHSLSMNGVTLRVEMKLWDGTERHVEYSGFKVGDASTNYTMTYLEMLTDMSRLSYDALEPSRGMQFSTLDRDNDLTRAGSCSNDWGDAGWWFNSCMSSHPNGLFDSDAEEPGSRVLWYDGDSSGTRALYLSEVSMMLQI